MKKFTFLFLILCSISGIVYGDIPWSAPAAISTPLTNASDPSVVLDSANNTTAIWVESNVIMSAVLPNGGSWSAPAAVSNPVGHTASSPRIGVDSSGNVTAIWIDNTNLFTAKLPLGGSWTTGVSVATGPVTSIELVVDDNGDAVAAWVLSASSIQAAVRNAFGGTWTSPSTISTGSGNSNPSLAINKTAGTTAALAWHAVSGTSDLITTNILTIGPNTWGTNKNVFAAATTFSHNNPKIAVDNNGNAVIAWFRYNFLNGNSYQNVQVLGATLTSGAASWGAPQLISASGIRNPADLSMKLKYDNFGNAIIVWVNSYDGQTFSIESSQRLFGNTTWGTSTLPYTQSLYSFGMDLAVASGTALLVEMQWDGSIIYLHSQESDTTDPLFQAWSITNPITTVDENSSPRCALSHNGTNCNAAAVWVTYDGANFIINAATGIGADIDPPTSVSASQSSTNLGVYTDYYNTITWSASSDPDVVQYSIFRNGVYFGSTDPSTLSFVDHNQTNGGTVTYGIAALTSSFRQSEIVSFTLFP